MPKRAVIFLFFLNSLLLSSSWAAGALDNGLGARALSLGKAFIGQADDGGAIFLNPAGTTALKAVNLINMYATPYEDTRFITLGAAFPGFLGGTAGLGFNNLTTFNVLVSGESVDYSQQDINFFYARQLFTSLSVGLNTKLLSKGTSKDIQPGQTGSGLDIDLSLKYSPHPWLGIGAALQNILPISMGGKISLKSGASESLPANFKVGSSTKLFGRDSLRGGLSDLFVNFDAEKSNSSPLLLHLGSEWQPTKFVALRLGFDQTTTVDYSQVFTHAALGFGLKFSGVTFDYTYYQRGEATKRVEHYFSLGYIGREETAAEKPKLKQIKRAHFSDISAGHWAQTEIETLSALGLLFGTTETRFKPNDNVSLMELQGILSRIFPAGGEPAPARPTKPATRLEAIRMIAQFASLPLEKVQTSPFKDFPGRHRLAALVAAAKKAGWLAFVGENLEPNLNLTRAELAALLYRTEAVQARLKESEIAY